ncbi:MAG TPA: hypothetical protein VJB89_03370 [Candidatus Nanoarchaeia archaeon]|nr:hypothetical protein [Candidatus Nanoarchaeia archaeon]
MSSVIELYKAERTRWLRTFSETISKMREKNQTRPFRERQRIEEIFDRYGSYKTMDLTCLAESLDILSGRYYKFRWDYEDKAKSFYLFCLKVGLEGRYLPKTYVIFDKILESVWERQRTIIKPSPELDFLCLSLFEDFLIGKLGIEIESNSVSLRKLTYDEVYRQCAEKRVNFRDIERHLIKFEELDKNFIKSIAKNIAQIGS